MIDCPLDDNFFACLNSGMQTLTQIQMLRSNIRISYDAAAIFANGLALSDCLERLQIQRECWFEPGAGLKLVEGIKRNKSLKDLDIHETNLGTVAMISILRAVSEGRLPKLILMDVNLNQESGCAKFLTELLSSDTCRVGDLVIGGKPMFPSLFRTDGVRMGKANRKLKALKLTWALLDESYLATMLPMMSTLLRLQLNRCEISDITPILDHLCRPSTAIKSIELCHNRIGIDQAEKFVRSMADMHSLTDLDIRFNPWQDGDEERVKNMLRKVSNCWNLQEFQIYQLRITLAQAFDLHLNMAINYAWRRDLCYKKISPPSKLLTLVIARAIRNTEHDLRVDVVLPLLRERMSNLIPACEEYNIRKPSNVPSNHSHCEELNVLPIARIIIALLKERSWTW